MTMPTDRIVVRYALHDAPDEASAREVAEAIRVEQTIEFPRELAADWIQEEVVGRIEEVVPGCAVISYDPRVAGGTLVQLLNVLWGNVSLFPNVRIETIDLPDEVLAGLRGPRFGVDGLRRHFAAPTRPLLATALKPMGSSPADLAVLAGTLAAGGLDIIKDDHSLADQPWAPWAERVARCAEAVNEAAARAGTRAAYVPSLNVCAPDLVERAHRAKELGAGGLMVLPGIAGFDAMRALADDDALALPLMAHPAMMGSLVVSPYNGIAHGIAFGTLMRLAGADLSVFPHAGGRFSFSADQCGQIRDACAAPLGSLASAWPAPGGGMQVDRVQELTDLYGADVCLLIGGALHRGDVAANARSFRAAAES